jgi:hypothetical protein
VFSVLFGSLNTKSMRYLELGKQHTADSGAGAEDEDDGGGDGHDVVWIWDENVKKR